MKNKKSTIYDVSSLANVSLATASRVINGSDKVSEKTKQKVLNAIKELNYIPNSTAVELASKKNTNVAIIVPEINYTHISNVLSGLMKASSELGYTCLIFTTKNIKKDIKEPFDKVLSLRVNGAIIFNDVLDEEELEELINFNIPVVTLGMDLKKFSSVSWHYKTQIMDIVNNALSRNKEVYFLSVEGAGKLEERILRGVKEAYLAKGKEFNNIIEVKDSYKGTYNKISEIVTSLPNCLFLSTRDSIALAALNAVLDLSLNVPNDYEFVALIGTKYSELSRPKLSSFNVNMQELGKMGMELLAEQIEDDSKVITKKLSIDFIKRGSSL
jgi:LacI family transcriptional regulator